MLELESPRWAQLRHAYGTADDIPELLSRLSREADSETIDTVFGSICHQGSVYSASFAAVPHLVSIALKQSDAECRAQVLILVGAIRSSTDYRGESEIPSDILEAYEQILPSALDASVRTLSELLDTDTAIYLLETAAALRGFSVLGRVLSGFSDREFALTCPACDLQLYIWPDVNRLSVAAEDPVSHSETHRTFTSPGPVPGSPDELAFSWIMGLAKTTNLAEVTLLLPHLFGTVVCPACGVSFDIMGRLNEELH
jgi:uncharacterized protein YbaR (Trm112 family)